MREIKFRFWDNELKKWLLQGRKGKSIYDFAFAYGMNWDFVSGDKALERVTVMQYTGLKDKNGKEIYEGDIITNENYPFFNGQLLNYVGEIGIDVDGCYYDLRRVSDRVFGRACGGNLSEINEQCKIIGNIYENPELLAVDKVGTK